MTAYRCYEPDGGAWDEMVSDGEIEINGIERDELDDCLLWVVSQVRMNKHKRMK